MATRSGTPVFSSVTWGLSGFLHYALRNSMELFACIFVGIKFNSQTVFAEKKLRRIARICVQNSFFQEMYAHSRICCTKITKKLHENLLHKISYGAQKLSNTIHADHNNLENFLLQVQARQTH